MYVLSWFNFVFFFFPHVGFSPNLCGILCGELVWFILAETLKICIFFAGECQWRGHSPWSSYWGIRHTHPCHPAVCPKTHRGKERGGSTLCGWGYGYRCVCWSVVMWGITFASCVLVLTEMWTRNNIYWRNRNLMMPSKCKLALLWKTEGLLVVLELRRAAAWEFVIDVHSAT